MSAICRTFIFGVLVKITPKIKLNYLKCFGILLHDNVKDWAPSNVCRICEYMIEVSVNDRSKLKFNVPTMWREPSSHPDNCYFCSINLRGMNKTRIKTFVYPNLEAAIRPYTIENWTPPPVDKALLEAAEEEVRNDVRPTRPNLELPPPRDEDQEDELSSDEEYEDLDLDEDDYSTPKDEKFSTVALNDLVRNLGHSKKAGWQLGQELKMRGCLQNGAKFYHLRDRDVDFRCYFEKDSTSVYCSDIEGLFRKFQHEHVPEEWRLFVDSSVKSLKAVLLCNKQKFPSIPIFYTEEKKEKRENIEELLKKINYNKYLWHFCGDLKMIGVTLGIQGTNASRPCFLCDWERPRSGEMWSSKKGNLRSSWIKGKDPNIVAEPLVPLEKVLLPPLHIKIEIMTQIMKVFVQRPELSKFIHEKFPRLSEAKIQNGVFNGPDIRSLMKDKKFPKILSKQEKRVWEAFRDVIDNFFGNFKSRNYRKIVANLMDAMKECGCKMTVKTHFLDQHVDYFPSNLGQYSEEQGERFHQELMQFESRYNRIVKKNILSDYCWNLVRESDGSWNEKFRHFPVHYQY
jgi:hypothetical protein